MSDSSPINEKPPQTTKQAAVVEEQSSSPFSEWIAQLLLASIVVGAGLTFYLFGPPAMILVFVATALGGAIWFMWSSLQRVGESNEMDFEEALSFAAPSVAEEQKRAVLRALKDLEYERHVGKISEEDFQQVSAEYRQKAKELIAAQDEKMATQIAAAEKRVSTFLKKEPAQEDTK